MAVRRGYNNRLADCDGGLTGRRLDGVLCVCDRQLAQCCDRQVELEKQIERPDADRVRLVPGKDLAPADLQTKIDHVRSCTTAV